ncbi:Hypothetical protein FKW44_004000, partial [Caligus rogercresseyi]
EPVNTPCSDPQTPSSQRIFGESTTPVSLHVLPSRGLGDPEKKENNFQVLELKEKVESISRQWFLH